MAIRNIQAEKQAIETFKKSTGKLPTTSQDWDVVHRYAYSTYNDLPDEFKQNIKEDAYNTPIGDLAASAVSSPSNQQQLTGQQQQQQSLTGLQKTQQEAQGQMGTAQQTQQQMTQGGGSFFQTLQNAIRAKQGYDQTSIGTSDIFQRAGITGFETIDQSLSAKKTELETSRTDLANLVNSVGSTWKAQAQTAKDAYDQAYDKWKLATEEVQKINKDLVDNEKAIQIAKLQHDLDIETEKWKLAHPSISDQISASEKGYSIENGKVTDPSKGIVAGFDISSYATDPNHEKSVASLVEGIGKFNSLSDVDAYIKRKYPDSPITAEMISNASEKYGTPWEIMVAMMEQDSSLGTAGKGARTFNPGNVGNDDSGNIRNYGDWQTGVYATADWLSKHRASTQKTSAGQSSISSLPKEQRSPVEALYTKFDSNETVKMFRPMSEAYVYTKNFDVNGNDPANDISLVYAFAKAMDPISVVREGEYAVAMKYNQTWKDNFGFNASRIIARTQLLTPEARQSMINTVKDRYDASRANYDNVYGETVRKINEITGKNNGEIYLTDYAKPGDDASKTGDDASKTGDYDSYLKAIGQ